MRNVRRTKYSLWAALGLLVGFVVYCRLSSPDLTWFNTHMSRDLSRAMAWSDFHPRDWMGPEINFGGRLFGPGFYWLIAPFWKLTRSIPALLVALHGLTLVLSFAVCRRLARDLGWDSGLMFAFLFLLMPVHVAVSRTLWNPSVIVPLNLGYLLCTSHAWRNPAARWPYVALFFLALLGIQTHFSSLPGFAACLLVLGIHFRRARPPLLCLAGVIAYAVLVCSLAKSGREFSSSLGGSFSLPSIRMLVSSLARWSYHLFPTGEPIGDYELFSILFSTGSEALSVPFRWLNFFFKTRPVYLLAFGVSIAACTASLISAYRKKQRPHFYVLLALVWTLFTIVPSLSYSRKVALPYRYGLALYPIQFLIPALAWYLVRDIDWGVFRGWKSPIRIAALAACGLLFFADGLFLRTTYRAMEVTGRASHTSGDDLEIPLRYKIKILGLARENAPEDEIYKYLHGGITNKIRCKEWDWDYTEYYAGVLKSLGPPPAITEHPRDHYHVTYLRPTEIAANAYSPVSADPAFPYHMVKLERDQQPKQVRLRRFGSDGEVLMETAVKDDELILPLSNAQFENITGRVEVFFRITSSARQLKIGYDDSPRATVLNLTAVLVNNKPVSFSRQRPGWLAQTTATALLPKAAGNEPFSVALRFEVKKPRVRFTRVDVYTVR